MPKVYTFNSIYPRKLWVVDASKEPPHSLANRFIFLKVDASSEIEDINKSFDASIESGMVAECRVAVEKKTSNVGIMVIIYDDMDTNTIAHESVHAADYICDELGIMTDSFVDGNEHYAYLVGWIAGKIAEVITNERKDAKTK